MFVIKVWIYVAIYIANIEPACALDLYAGMGGGGAIYNS